MRALTAIVPNPSMDRVEVVPELAFGRPLRAQRTLEWPGGSGTHAALVARALGVARVTVVAPVGGSRGARWVDALRRRGIETATVAIGGGTRSNVSVLDAKGLNQVEVVESGPTLDEAEASQFAGAALQALAEDSVVVLSGSFPSGLGLALVTELARRASLVGARLVCDLGGPALGLALQARVDWAKANFDEVRSWRLTSGLGAAPPTDASGPGGVEGEVVAWLEEIGRVSPETNVVLTRGADGAFWRGRGGISHVRAPQAPAFNPIGCGDAMVGAMAAALCADLDAGQVVCWGVAAAVENLAHAEPGIVDRRRFGEILDTVVLGDLSGGAA